MYEKYSGLPDTAKPASSGGVRKNAASSVRGSNADANGRDTYYSSSRSGSSAGSAGKRKSSKRAKVRKRRFVLALMTLLLIALIVTAVAVLARSCDAGPSTVDPLTAKFKSNVYINGTNVSGKTVDEVREQLVHNETYTLENIAITLSSESFNAVITGADMQVTSNLEELIQTALAGEANQDYTTTVFADDAALQARIQAINAAMGGPADASFTVDLAESGKPTFNYTEGTPGYGLDVASTAQMVKDALAAHQLQTTLTPSLTTVQPSVTAEDLKALHALIGSYSTTYDFKGTAEDTEEQRTVLIPNRAFNIEKAASLINYQIIKPGETWSFNDTVGDRTEARGWKEANGIFGGDRLNKQFGGGVCQVSTTLFNALLEAYPYFADTFVRQHHSFPSNYVDKGLDATVDTDHIDFKFTNNSPGDVYIFAYASKNKMSSTRKRDLNVLIYGPALPEGAEYKTRTQVVEVIPAGEDILIDTNSLFIGETETLAEKRDGYVVDVYIDYYLNGVLQDDHFMYTDRYEGNPLKMRVGTKATPEPIATPNPDDAP